MARIAKQLQECITMDTRKALKGRVDPNKMEEESREVNRKSWMKDHVHEHAACYCTFEHLI